MRYDGLLCVYDDTVPISIPRVMVKHSLIQQMGQKLHFSQTRFTKRLKEDVSFAEPFRWILDTGKKTNSPIPGCKTDSVKHIIAVEVA